MRPESTARYWLRTGYVLIATAGVVALGVIGWLQQDELERAENERASLLSTLATTSDALAVATSTVAQLEQELLDTTHRLRQTEEELDQEVRQVDRFRRQIEEITGTVATLDRLAQLDRELLQKYSRTFFLNENYRPARMTRIPDRWVLEGRQEQYFLTDAWPFLEDMLRSAERDGIDLRIVSAFRSFDEQGDLNQQFVRQFGTGANAFSATQGFSEHQLGTAIDVVDPETGGTFSRFANTEAFTWLSDNAHRYGFILSYPEGNEFYIFEPWHWRFVGRQLATDLYNAGEYFYDWDQRVIDTYLIKIFD